MEPVIIRFICAKNRRKNKISADTLPPYINAQLDPIADHPLLQPIVPHWTDVIKEEGRQTTASSAYLFAYNAKKPENSVMERYLRIP